MKKNPSSTLFVLAILLAPVMQSCMNDDRLAEPKPENSLEITVLNGRLNFPSTKSYFGTIEKVAKMSPDEFSQFAKKYDFTSLLASTETSSLDVENLKMLPPAYQAILNERGEVTIGDTIVWYAANGTKHLVPNLDEKELSNIKQGLTSSKITQEYSMVQVPTVRSRNMSAGRTEYWWPNPSNGAHLSDYQHEFHWSGSPNLYKYVTEMWNVKDGISYWLFMNVKLEWKGSKWREASETRIIYFSITGTIELVNGFYGLGSPETPYYYGTYSGNQWNLMKYDYLYSGSPGIWDFTLYGSVYQEIVADPNSGWLVNNSPLW